MNLRYGSVHWLVTTQVEGGVGEYHSGGLVDSMQRMEKSKGWCFALLKHHS